MKNPEKYLIDFADKCKKLKYEQVITGNDKHPSGLYNAYRSPEEKAKYTHYYTNQIAICAGGKCLINIDNKYYLLLPGSVCLTSVKKMHYETYYDKETGYEIIWLAFEKNYLRIKYKISDPETGYKEISHLEIITGNKELNSMHHKTVKGSGKKLIMNNICGIFNLIKRKLEKGDYIKIEPKKKTKYDLKINKSRLEKAQEYIMKHYAEKIKMSDISKELGLHPVYCNCLLKDVYNFSVKQQVIGCRLTKAAELMKETELTISEISYKVGYKNPHFFCRIFKKHMGITPKAYRKKYLTK